MPRITAGVKPPTKPQQAQPAQMADIALTAWLDFQLAAYDLGGIQERGVTHRQRLAKAALWFGTHGTDDPRYEEARSLRIEVENAQTTDDLLFAQNAKRAMHHLWNLVLAFERAREDVDLWRAVRACDDLHRVSVQYENVYASKATRLSVGSIVALLWLHLLPAIPTPHYDPTNKRANWVEWRLGCVPVWSISDLEEALDQRRTGDGQAALLG